MPSLGKLLKRVLGLGGGDEEQEAGRARVVEEGETAQAPVELPEGPMFIGIIGAKGGAGKSTIAASLALAGASLLGSSLLVDLDVLNATSTNMLTLDSSMLADIKEDVSVLDYLLTPDKRMKFIKIMYPPDRQLALVSADGRRRIVPKNLYLLPGKLPRLDYMAQLDRIHVLRKRELATHFDYFARTLQAHVEHLGIRLVVLDFPPLKITSGKYFGDVLELINYLTNARYIAVSRPYDAEVHGLITLLSTTGYSPIWDNLLSVVLQPVDKHTVKDAPRLAAQILTHARTRKVYFIRRDKKWSVNKIPPVALQKPTEGASVDFFYMVADLGIIPPNTIKEKLGFDPLKADNLTSGLRPYVEKYKRQYLEA